MILIISTAIFLFTLYILSIDDFVFLRKNITITQIFDIAFVAGAIGLLLSRIVHIALHPSLSYLNPLVFLVIPYFPGLTISGFLLGTLLAIIFFAFRQKLPIGKLFDIFSLSFLTSGAVYFLGNGLQDLLTKHIYMGSVEMIVLIYFSLTFVVLKHIYGKTVWKDGSIAEWSLTAFIMGLVIVQIASVHFHIQAVTQEVYAFVGLLIGVFLATILHKLQ